MKSSKKSRKPLKRAKRTAKVARGRATNLAGISTLGVFALVVIGYVILVGSQSRYSVQANQAALKSAPPLIAR